MQGGSPWVKHFDLNISDAELDRRVAIPAKPVRHLSELSIDEARSTLDRTMKGIVVPNAQMRSALRQLAATGRSFASARYPSERAFLKLVYSKAPVELVPPVICLTGLAGVGKSEIIKSFHRLFPPGGTVEVSDHSAFPLVGSWRITFAGHSGITKLLMQNFRNSDRKAQPRCIAEKAAEEVVFQGVSLITTDELQFLTQSSANTLAAKYLLQISNIGPPLVFISNYSMLHRLMKRPQEEKQRLLASPIDVTPDIEDSADWQTLVRELLRAAPELSELRRSSGIEAELHRYTFGIKRSLVLLLCTAYAHARRRSKIGNVGIGDIESAFMSIEYSSSRDDIKALLEGTVNTSKLRSDLRCPLTSADARTAPSSSVATHPAAAQHAERSSEAALLSSLNSSELAAYESAKRNSNSAKSENQKRHARPSASIDNLVDGAAKFAQSRTKSRS